MSDVITEIINAYDLRENHVGPLSCVSDCADNQSYTNSCSWTILILVPIPIPIIEENAVKQVTQLTSHEATITSYGN